jgi:hypothetical protein
MDFGIILRIRTVLLQTHGCSGVGHQLQIPPVFAGNIPEIVPPTVSNSDPFCMNPLGWMARVVLAVLAAPWVALVARRDHGHSQGGGVFGSSDVGGLMAIALIWHRRLRCYYQEVHAADHGYPRTRLAKWKGLRVTEHLSWSGACVLENAFYG